jgi:hypothetical protein
VADTADVAHTRAGFVSGHIVSMSWYAEMFAELARSAFVVALYRSIRPKDATVGETEAQIRAPSLLTTTVLIESNPTSVVPDTLNGLSVASTRREVAVNVVLGHP